jgi:hypothetical protein
MKVNFIFSKRQQEYVHINQYSALSFKLKLAEQSKRTFDKRT